MAVFPDLIGDQYKRTAVYQATVSRFGEQAQVAYRRWMRPRWQFDLVWTMLEQTDYNNIEVFLHSMYGPVQPFFWFDWKPFSWRFIPIAYGDGTTVAFPFPGMQTSAQLFKANETGTLVIDHVSYGAGSNGEDVVTFTVPPTAGVLITASFVGRRMFPVTTTSIGSFTAAAEPIGLYGWTATFSEIKGDLFGDDLVD